MLKFSRKLIRKVYLQNKLINYLSFNFKFILFVNLFKDNVNSFLLLKKDIISCDISYLSIFLKNLYYLLNHTNNKFYHFNNIFKNKGIKMIKFNTLNELIYYLNKTKLFIFQDILLLGGFIEDSFWTVNDLKLLQNLNYLTITSSILKINFYLKSFKFIFSFISLLYKINK